MSTAGVRRGFLKKYGGLVFKQWKEKYVVLTAEGSLVVCKGADSPPEQVVALRKGCKSIVEGREILDLPRLPPGGRRDCCFALLLPQEKFLLMLSDDPDDCIQWLKLLRKVKESMSSPLTPKRQRGVVPCITDRRPGPETPVEGEPPSPSFSDQNVSSPRAHSRQSSVRSRGSHNPSGVAVAHPDDCLRHGNSSDARAVRAVCLLMGGAAASSALGYLTSCSSSSLVVARAPEVGQSGGFSGLGGGAPYHAGAEDADPPHFNSFDFEGDSDFEAFDCGGFTF